MTDSEIQLKALVVLKLGWEFQEIAPTYRPYPKPTQVGGMSIPRRLRELG